MDVWNPQYLLYKYERERKRTSTNYMEIKISCWGVGGVWGGMGNAEVGERHVGELEGPEG
jgi:hypothetical protein